MMDIHTATEQAYKNGYAQGKADAAEEIKVLKDELDIWKQDRFNIFQTTECYQRAQEKVAREIFEELERTVMHGNWASEEYKKWYFAELKKKYEVKT